MGTSLRIAGIVEESIVDGPGIRLTVFTQGCRHNCEGCHNPETHLFDGGNSVEVEVILKQLKKNPLLDGITLSGGEPFEQAPACAELAKEARKLGLHVMTYTGYTYEYIIKNTESREGWKELLHNTQILVDGKFEIQKKSIELRFRGSLNQRLIDVERSLQNNKVIETDLK